MNGKISIIVRGNISNLSILDEVLSDVAIIHKKGDFISNGIDIIDEYIWILSSKFDDNNINTALHDLIVLLGDNKDLVMNLLNYKGVDIVVRCSIQSDYAQMYYELSNESLKILSDLNIKLCFSILSWGGVEN